MKEHEGRNLDGDVDTSLMCFERSAAFDAFIEEGLRDIEEGRVEPYTREQMTELLEQCIGKSASR